MNPCELRSRMRSETRSVPAKIFAYAAMCLGIRERALALQEQAKPVTNHLPYASGITSRISPQAATRAHWSYLKY